ncbi:MAG: CsgG/HfaB family protein, partial [Planctomycetia bacterium]|nr:CsgG/HfaB family protein [Planctomycetia bacterium]
MVKRLMRMAVIGFVLIASAGIAHAAGDDAAKTQPALPTVVVLDYQAEMPGEKDLGWKLAEILAARLSIEDSLQLVERAQLSKIIKEQQLKLEGILDQDQAAKVGKLLGAKLMIMGKAFVLNKKFIIVTKVVGVETGRVKGTVREVELKKPISDTVTLLAEDIAALIKKNYASLLPPGSKRDDPTAKIRKKLGDRAPLVVAVVVPETHLTRIIATPAAETEIKRTLIECGFRVVDTGKVDLSDWAKAVYRGKRLPWPASLKKADVVIVGKASSRFTLRTGDLVTSTGKAQVDLIDRHTGKTLLTRRATSQAVDLAEITAGKTALQKAGREIGLAIARHLVALKTSAKKPITKSPTRKPTAKTPVAKAAKAPVAKAAKAPKRTLFTA